MSQQQQKDDYDWAYGPITTNQPQSPPLTPGSAQYTPLYYPSHGPSLSLSVPVSPYYNNNGNAWSPYQQQQQQQYFPQQEANPYFAARPGHVRSVSEYGVQQGQGLGYAPVGYSGGSPPPVYTPQQTIQSNNPFFGSSSSSSVEKERDDIPVPMSAPPVMGNNPFAEPPSPPRSDTGVEAEVADDLDLSGKEKRMDSYEILDIYWDQNFSAVLTPADDAAIASDNNNNKDNKKKKDKDRYERKKPSYFFESRPFSSQKTINSGGDVTLHACGRQDPSNSASASESLEKILESDNNTTTKKSKKEKPTSAYDGKGTIVGCVRYHHANWKGHWKMHVCMGQPSSLESAHFEWMTQNGVVKDRHWTLEGFSFKYTSPDGEPRVCRKFSVKGTKSAIPDDVEAYTKHGNLKMQDAEYGTTVAVYLRNAVSVHKRGRMLIRKGLSDEFRDFAVLCLLGIDERRQRDFRNSTYCASGWWVHMAARGIAGDRMKKARE